jgi:hypothetical protein
MMPMWMIIVWGVPCDIIHSKGGMKELVCGLVLIFIISFLTSLSLSLGVQRGGIKYVFIFEWGLI